MKKPPEGGLELMAMLAITTTVPIDDQVIDGVQKRKTAQRAVYLRSG